MNPWSQILWGENILKEETKVFPQSCGKCGLFCGVIQLNFTGLQKLREENVWKKCVFFHIRESVEMIKGKSVHRFVHRYIFDSTIAVFALYGSNWGIRELDKGPKCIGSGASRSLSAIIRLKNVAPINVDRFFGLKLKAINSTMKKCISMERNKENHCN